MHRRELLAFFGITAIGSFAKAQERIPIADAHNHLGLLRRNTDSVPKLSSLMRDSGVSLLSWTVVPDAPFLRVSTSGVEQSRTVNFGELASSFERQIGNAKRGIYGSGITIVRTVEDIEKASKGESCIVLTTEGADFLEGSLDGLPAAYEEGIRHIQLVHYIQNKVGDLQTERPVHSGLSEFGKKLIKALNGQGILIDLAHSTGASIDQAMELTTVPMIWSHGYISSREPAWTAGGWKARGLSEVHAKKFAQTKGAVGLWCLSASFGGGLDGYASEIIRMINLLGPDHVMFGSDEDGLPSGAVIEQLGDLRKVVDILAKRGLDEKTLRAVAFGNYARCLKSAFSARTA
jgi:membrane dipeptidase